MPYARRVRRALLLVALNIILPIALIEGVLLTLLHVPRVTAASPAPVRRLAQQVYRHFNRTLIQFDPDCARYDPEVTYTLKPGTCRFGNLEFENSYRINRAGLRDDDASLVSPEIIVIGDSHAMGWGVEQDETLAAVVAKQTGKTVLNAAVSSYGTVREMRTLDRVDTSNLRVLIIQYADNDQPENRTFRDQSNRLPITDREHYDRIVRYYAGQRAYFPGKYVYRLTMKVLRLEEPEPDQLKMEILPPAEEAALFLNALEHGSGTRLDDVQVLVFAIHQEVAVARAFTLALAEESRRPGRPPFVQRLIALNTAAFLTLDEFYVLDDHMNAKGHKVIGEKLAGMVRNLEN